MTVEMTAPYLGLSHLVRAMAQAVVKANRNAEELQNPEEMEAEAAQTWESNLRGLAERGAIKGHDWDSLGEAEWRSLDIERDVFFIDDLNDCKDFTRDGIRFVVVEEELNAREFLEAFEESVNNDPEPIDWGYWVGKMTKLSAGEAARLMAALDPDIYKELGDSPVGNDTSKARKRALNIERLAVREGREYDSPFGWLLWATEQGFQVHGGYSREVNAKKKQDDAAKALEQLPAREVAYWKNGVPKSDGIRQVTFAFAGNLSTRHFTLPQFVDEVADRLTRWQDGEYAVIEAAQVLADANPSLDAQSLVEQMEYAMHTGKLVLRQNDIPISAINLLRKRLWNRFVRAEDVNDWLTASRARYLLTYPYTQVGTAERPKELRVSDEDWKQLARTRAAEIIREERARDLYPSQEDIAYSIAKGFREQGVVGADGKPLSGATIKRHALRGISSAIGKQLSTGVSRGK